MAARKKRAPRALETPRPPRHIAEYIQMIGCSSYDSWDVIGPTIARQYQILDHLLRWHEELCVASHCWHRESSPPPAA